jgi:hypothetical protein
MINGNGTTWPGPGGNALFYPRMPQKKTKASGHYLRKNQWAPLRVVIGRGLLFIKASS